MYQSAILPLSICHLLLNFNQICHIGRGHKGLQDALARGHTEPVGPLGPTARRWPMKLTKDTCTHHPMLCPLASGETHAEG